MKALIDDIIELSLIEMWTIEDARIEKRKNSKNSKWLNVLVKKINNIGGISCIFWTIKRVWV